MSWLICIAGEIASGKSTLARELQAELQGSTLVAFGDVVRRHAQREGLAPSRQNLQRTGRQLIAAGWPAFVDQLLALIDGESDVLIVEGIRHLAAVDELGRRLPDRQCLLIFLGIDEASQQERLDARGEARQALGHAVEQEVRELRSTADLFLSGASPLEELVQEVVDRLSHDPKRSK